jgi:hypothetical protein
MDLSELGTSAIQQVMYMICSHVHYCLPVDFLISIY